MNAVTLTKSQVDRRNKEWLAAVAPALTVHADGSATLDTSHPSAVADKHAYRVCTSRGEHVDTVPCKTCEGSVKAKVFACTVHGRCSMFKNPVKGAKNCKTCLERTI